MNHEFDEKSLNRSSNLKKSITKLELSIKKFFYSSYSSRSKIQDCQTEFIKNGIDDYHIHIFTEPKKLKIQNELDHNPYNPTIFYPNDQICIIWQNVIFACILQIIIMAPQSMINETDCSGSLSANPIKNRNLFFCQIFIVDVFFNFNFAQQDKSNNLIFDRNMIGKNQLNSQFILDVISTIPFESILCLFSENQTSSVHSALFKFPRLWKMTKLWSINTFYKNLANNEALKEQLDQYVIISFIFKLLGTNAVFLIAGHICASIMINIILTYGVSQIIFDSTGRDENTPAQNNNSLQIDTFYWAIQTMTTVGYGDHWSYSIQAIITHILVMVFGNMIFQMIISQNMFLQSTYMSLNKDDGTPPQLEQMKRRQSLSASNQWAIECLFEHHTDSGFRKDLKKFQFLPSYKRDIVYQNIKDSFDMKIPLFQSWTLDEFLKLIKEFKMKQQNIQYNLTNENDKADQFQVISKGSVKYRNKFLKIWRITSSGVQRKSTSGDVFGLEDIIFKHFYSTNIQTQLNTEILYIKRVHLLKLLTNFEIQNKLINSAQEQLIEELRNKQAIQFIFVQLLKCNTRLSPGTLEQISQNQDLRIKYLPSKDKLDQFISEFPLEDAWYDNIIPQYYKQYIDQHAHKHAIANYFNQTNDMNILQERHGDRCMHQLNDLQENDQELFEKHINERPNKVLRVKSWVKPINKEERLIKRLSISNLKNNSLKKDDLDYQKKQDKEFQDKELDNNKDIVEMKEKEGKSGISSSNSEDQNIDVHKNDISVDAKSENDKIKNENYNGKNKIKFHRSGTWDQYNGNQYLI